MQQTTINLPSTNPVRALTGLARQIALPGEHAPERFPSFPALERTALMAFTQPTTWNVGGGVDFRGFLSRQATYPMWLESLQTSIGSYYASWLSDATNATASGTAGSLSFQGVPVLAQGVGNVAAATLQAGIAGSVTPLQFSYSLLGVDQTLGPSPFIYVPTGWRVNAIVSGTSPPANNVSAELNYEYWVGPGSVDTGFFSTVITAGNTGALFGFAPTGRWIRPVSVNFELAAAAHAGQFLVTFVVTNSTGAVYVASAVDPGTVTLNTVITIGTLLPAFSPSEFANSSLPWRDTRVTASAALLTNVTQVLNKGGTVLAGRISPEIANPWTVTAAVLTNLHPAEKAYLPMETGMYTYCPPSTDMANFWDYSTHLLGGVVRVPVYRLDNTSLVNHFVFNSAPSEVIAVSTYWHFEFRTSSALFQIALSGLTLEALHSAQLVLAAAGFFFENPEHQSVLNKVMAAAKKVVPHLLNIAEMHPATASLARGVRMVMTPTVAIRNGPSKPPATSAKASGITTPARKNKRPKKVKIGPRRKNGKF